MNDIVIKAENLGKKYIIGHQSVNGPYLALRDVMAQNASAFWQKSRNLLQGKPVIPGDSLEEVWALKEVSFEVRRGEVLGIIGRNGAGKSTLLKILSRITELSEGRVTIKGRVASLLEVGTGFHPELTGRENIYLNGAILGMTRQEIKRKFDEIVAFSEVEKFLDTPVKRYSSGMYVRMAFSVAAHLEAEILLVDEILSVGDGEFQRKSLGKMEDIRHGGRTVLFVSHNLGAIASLCQRSLLIVQGHLSQDSSTRSVISEYMSGQQQEGMIDLRNWNLDRRGCGPMKILYVQCKNSSGKPAATFEHGEPIDFYMGIRGKKGSDIILGVSIRNDLGQLILHYSNLDDKAKLVLHEDECDILMRIPHNLLNDGRYYVTIWLGDKFNTLSDRAGNCLSFRVDSQHQGRIISNANVRLPATWETLSAIRQ
jgi:lipopolysaccharide transport system ATP-binding protein